MRLLVVKKNKKKVTDKPINKKTGTNSSVKDNIIQNDGDKQLKVVALVASAGGLAPLQTIVEDIPKDTGASFFILQHLASNHLSYLPNLISQHTDLPVYLASDGDKIAANTIYICPPGAIMLLEQDIICIQSQINPEQRQQIFDIFLESISKSYFQQAIAVILSGAGDDGRKGAAILRQSNGLLLVQEPDTAEFRSMPEQAINNSAPDQILPPNKIGPMLVALLNDTNRELTLEPSSSGYLRILALLLRTSHIDFARYKPATIQRRISRRMLLNQMSGNLELYLQLLESSPEEREILARDMLIGVSSFFRDPEVFEHLKNTYLPSLMSKREGSEFRIWIAGCATGEEAYSYAILCQEYQESTGQSVDLKILASDLNPESIRIAGLGIYSENTLQSLPKAYLKKYFNKVPNGYRVIEKIRKCMIFFQHDLTEDIPFSNIDLISCRNVFIYLKPGIQQHVKRSFGFGLRVGGLLVLSPSESLGLDTNFEVLEERLRLYRLVNKPRLMSLALPSWRRGLLPPISADQPIPNLSITGRDDALRERLLQLLAGRYVPLVLVLNQQNDIVYVLGDGNGILHYPSGELVNNLTRLVDTSLRLPLLTGLRGIAKTGDEQVFTQVPVKRGETETLMNIRMCALTNNISANNLSPKEIPCLDTNSNGFSATTLVAVLFENIQLSATAISSVASGPNCDIGLLSQQRMSELEEELFFTKQSLRSAVEELETANEELQSSNEEMQSGNEELQSTNEELQSTNEELIVVNTEYQQKVSELSRAYDDINNLMLSADIVTLFVDCNKNIRHASPCALRLLHLITQDIGRPIEHIAHRMLRVNLVELVDKVLQTDEPCEFEGQADDGRTYIIKVNPYETFDGKLSGVTLNFIDITSFQKLEAKMQRLATVVTNANDAIMLLDSNGNIISWNHGAEQLYGYSEVEALELNATQLIPAALQDVTFLVMDKVRAGEIIGSTETKRLTKGGLEIDVRASYTKLSDGSAQGTVIAAMEHDITRSNILEDEIRLAAVAFQTIDGIMITDEHGSLLRVNQAFTRITGFSESEVIGKEPSFLNSGRQNALFYKRMWKTLIAEGSWSGELWNKNKAGEIYPEWLTINTVKDKSGEISHYIWVFRDISDKKAQESKIHQLAFYDPLTDLPNRRLFIDRFKQAISRCQSKKSLGALFFIDLDRFKTINDSLGHNVGDELLKQVSRCLQSVLRAEDTVARLGGDEFVIIITDIGFNNNEAVTNVEGVSQKIFTQFEKPFAVLGQDLHTSPSIGVTFFPDNEDTEEDFIRQADNAMYLAKKMGRNTLRFFDPSLQSAADKWLDIENSLRIAVKEKQFELYYQPQLNVQNGCTSAEALIRWNRPKIGMISPDDFIPVCETTGLIVELGSWVILEACQQLATWQSNGHDVLTRIAVNVSPKQFRHESFESVVISALQSTAVSPESLELEITENLLLEDIHEVSVKMARLRKLGVRFTIDDFGTGYSSLAYIKRLPIHKIKIDQTFVRDLSTSADDACIVESTIAMAIKMNLAVIAEGVETKKQEVILKAFGCNDYQGYLYSKPLPVTEFIKALKKLNTAYENANIAE
jgi:two-component system CheB/CheR fusion protein